ncbi:transketolase family protein [Megasphaera stantonii]|uniref:Transketolase n=1 Tax=Megasphaera stantonii TaxID=2144175 RepID=A0A346B1U1_9FIRM|nr:transketolase C-terminal domain-containing protein [Megasphaera stantonii]AXL22084.1 transketolase [Megasphaera stantonii]
MRNHVIARIAELAQTDKRVMLLTADLGFNVVNIFSGKYPDRYINVGIAEQNMTSIAAGLALEGNMVFTYSIGNFPTLRCIEQIRNLVCYHNANVKILAVGGGFAYGSLGMTHHATEDIAMMRSLPNMKVYVPSDEIEAVACLNEIYWEDGPAYLRMARGKEECIHFKGDKFDINKLVKIEGNEFNICILASGTILSEAVKVKKALENYGVHGSVYSVPRIKPIDSKGILDLAKKAQLIITMEEHNIIGGLGGAVAELLSSLKEHAPLLRFGLSDVFTGEVGSQTYLREYYGLSSDKVIDKIIHHLNVEV